MNNLTTWFLNSENQQVSENITDVPPITFNSNGEPLTNWKITGSQAGVGDATENLFDINAATQGHKINIIFSGAEAAVQEEPSIEFIEDSDFLISDFIPCNVLEDFSCSFKSPDKNTNIPVVFFDENKNFIDYGLFVVGTQVPSFTRTFDKMISVESDKTSYKYFQFSLPNNCTEFMLTKTATAQTYEPYGYKIPIECGNTITNIYIDEPLYEEDSISYKDTKVTIPTIDGENELSIGTINAPTSVSIQTNGVSQGFRDYFKAQMMINND